MPDPAGGSAPRSERRRRSEAGGACGEGPVAMRRGRGFAEEARASVADGVSSGDCVDGFQFGGAQKLQFT